MVSLSGERAASSPIGLAEESDNLVASSAADHSTAGSSSGAAMPPQRECGDETIDDSEGSEEESEDESGTNSDGDPSDDGLPSSCGQVHREAGNSSGSAGSADSSETAPGPRDLEPADALGEPATSLSAASVRERAAAMSGTDENGNFKTGGSEVYTPTRGTIVDHFLDLGSLGVRPLALDLDVRLRERRLVLE